MRSPQAVPTGLRRCRLLRRDRLAALGLVLVLIQQAMLSEHAAAGDAGAGRKVFARCSACHMVGPDASDQVGPSLNGVIGRRAASAPTFSYSAAMMTSGLVWTEAKLRAFVKSPRTTVPGTRMAFGGLSQDKDVDDLLAYLKQFDGAGKTR